MKKWLTLGMAATLLFVTACSSTPDSNEGIQASTTPAASTKSSDNGVVDPYGPMEKTVTISIGKSAPQDPKLASGNTVEDNELTRYISEKLNVKYVDAWQAIGDAYVQKVSVILASGDIPDVMAVNQKQLSQMAEAGLIEDLTGVFNKYASPNLKAAYESTDGYSLNAATFDGKLMAIPNITPGADAENLLWLRKDWLDELGLQPPKTIDDIINVTKMFMEKKGSTGIPSTQSLVTVGNNFYGFDTVFSLYNSYPQMWIKNEQGEVGYGSITPETKKALTKLHEMYEQGLIVKEFALNKPEQNNELVVSGKTGIFFGPWWIPFSPLNDSIKQDSKAEWVAYLAPLGEDGRMNTHIAPASNEYLVVKKGFEHPEAVVKTANYQFDIDQSQAEGIISKDTYNWVNMPFTLLLSRYDDKEVKALAVKSVIDGKAGAETLKGEANQIYLAYLKDKASPKKDNAAWSQSNAFLTGALPLSGDGINKKLSLYSDITETMRGKWANLLKLENETFLKIILGTEKIEYFDTFVKKWQDQGGNVITEEVKKEITK